MTNARRSRPFRTLALMAAAVAFSSPTSRAAIPEYRVGDIAVEDVVTPVRLVVPNREATDALKQKVAAETFMIVLHDPAVADAAENALRQTVAEGRRVFLETFSTLRGRRGTGPDINRTAYNRAVREVGRTTSSSLPLDVLAPLWARDESDDEAIEALLRPLRAAMARPVIAVKNNDILPPYQRVRLVPVTSLEATPPPAELETAGEAIMPGKIIGAWRARNDITSQFGAGQERAARFAASFVRPNARVEPALTEQIRAQRTRGLAATDTYEAAQLVVRKGQAIDEKALSALAVLRERNLIGALQTQLAQQQSAMKETSRRVTWIASGLGMVCVLLAGLAWRFRSRSRMALVPLIDRPPLAGAALPALVDGNSGNGWQSRALAAEARADRAHAAIRSGVLGWMRERVFQMLFRHRTELLSTQQVAEAEIRELEQRLEKVHGPLQARICAYEHRIAELERELAAKGEQDPASIGTRLSVARQQMNRERERGEFGTN